jgi:FixJ family two-component response regulator
MHTILILEDDLHLRATLEEELIAEGFNVTGTDSSDTVLDLTFEQRFDLYLFDVNVIGMDGFLSYRHYVRVGIKHLRFFSPPKTKLPMSSRALVWARVTICANPLRWKSSSYGYYVFSNRKSSTKSLKR